VVNFFKTPEMKKSKAITLVLLTSTIFLGCEDKIRNKYNSWDDCQKDYGDSKSCEEEKERTDTGYRRVYYGPWYRVSQAGDARYNPSAQTHRSAGIVRGGFGSSGLRSGG